MSPSTRTVVSPAASPAASNPSNLSNSSTMRARRRARRGTFKRFGLLATAMLIPVIFATSPGSVSASSSERVTGPDRYSTSVDVARRVGSGSLTGLSRLIVVTGDSFPDGLTAAGLAGFLDNGGRSGRTAILLTRTEVLPDVVASAITASDVPASRIFVVGGPAAVSESVVDAVARAAGWDGTASNPVTRIGGNDRFETATAIVDYVTSNAAGSLESSYRTVLVANGSNFPDALAGGALAYRNGHLIVLSRTLSTPRSTLDAIEMLSADCALILGGTSALSTQVEALVEPSLAGSGCGVERVGGSTRYSTATLIASRFVAVNGPAAQVILTSGEDFADALTAAPLAGRNFPIVFTAPGVLSATTWAWLQNNGGAITNIVVIGNPTLIPPTVANQAVAAAAPTPVVVAPPPTSAAPAPAPVVSGWAAQSISTHGAEGTAIARLGDGSAIVTGYFSGTATIGATVLNSAGDRDIFVAKINANGEWAWAARAGGTGADRGQGVSTLSDGSTIVTGYFNGTATVGATVLTSAGNNDVFVAKINANGNWVWAARAGGTGADRGQGVSTLSNGSAAIVTGYFLGTAYFPGAVTGSALNSTGGNAFVAKIDTNGNWVWATNAVGGTGEGVSTLSDGSAAIVTGYFSGTATVGATVLTSAGNNDVFVAKINADGTWAWATQSTGTGTAKSYAISAGIDGSAIVTGYLIGTVSFGTPLSSVGFNFWNPFVAKINANGTWAWATTDDVPDDGLGYGVSTLSDGSAIVTGTSYLLEDAFIAKIGPTGNWLWNTTIGASSWAEGYGVTTFSDGSAIATGYFEGNITIGGPPISSAGDMFAIRIRPNGTFG